MPITLLLAWSFFKQRRQRSMATVFGMCFFSIFLGAFSLTLIAAIIQGLHMTTQESLKGIHADIIIRSGKALDFDKIKKILDAEFGSFITSISPSAYGHALIQSGDKKHQAFVVCKAIDPHNQTIIPDIQKAPPEQAEQIAVYVSEKIADSMNLKQHDTINLLLPSEETSGGKSVTLNQESAAIMQLFKTGMHEFDEHVILMPIGVFEDIFKSGITEINIMITPAADDQELIKKLKDRFKLDVISWKELYPPLWSALKLEKYATIIILTLICIIAMINLISLLFMIIAQKRETIAILLSLGMSTKSIQLIFALFSSLLSMTATACGIACAALTGHLITTYKLIQLPDAYFSPFLPAYIDGTLIIFIFLASLIISLLVTLIPLHNISSMRVTDMLKNDSL